MAVLKKDILDHLLLRRTKLQCADDLALPPRYCFCNSGELLSCNIGGCLGLGQFLFSFIRT